MFQNPRWIPVAILFAWVIFYLIFHIAAFFVEKVSPALHHVVNIEYTI